MEPTTEIESPEVFNKDLLEAIAGAEDGHLKSASAAASKMVRRRIRENGFSRLILPYKQISDTDLNQLPDTELPVIIEEMEPFSPGAKSISFNDSADTEFSLRKPRRSFPHSCGCASQRADSRLRPMKLSPAGGRSVFPPPASCSRPSLHG